MDLLCFIGIVLDYSEGSGMKLLIESASLKGRIQVMASKRILVAGAGGFIGGHLVRRLKSEGFWSAARTSRSMSLPRVRRMSSCSAT